MSDIYFKASLQNTLNPEVGTFDNVNNKDGIFTLEDGEYYLTNNTSNSYRVYYPTENIYSVGFTVEFDVNYNGSSGFEWCLLFNGDDSTYWHGFGTNGTTLEFRGQSLSIYNIVTSPATWLHVKCVFDYYNSQNIVHVYVNNSEVNTFTISKDYGIKYIDILGNSGGYVADAKIKNIIIYNSSKKHYLDSIGLTTLWSKIKSLFATKTELGSKANDSDVVHKSGDETITGSKTFTDNIAILKSSPFCNLFTNNYIKGEAPSSNIYQGIRFYDDPNSSSANHITGGFEITYDTTGYTITSINARTYVNGSQLWRSINLRVPNDSTRSIDFYPVPDSEINLGTASYKWKDVYATTFHGNLVGNADTATKATQDSDGNQINTTYSKVGHIHDDRYYTESEIDTKLNAKANDSEVVHKSGDETITGTKTFNNNIKLVGNTDLITNTSDATYTNIVGGTSSSNSSFLQLVGNEWGYEPNRGAFSLCANNGTNRCELQGKPDGTLVWAGKNLDGIDSSSSNWIRYITGLQIVFTTTDATFNNSATASVTVTLPVSFRDNLYQVITENSGGGTDFLLKMTTDGHTTTSFNLYCKNENNITGTRQVRYIAIGFWK